MCESIIILASGTSYTEQYSEQGSVTYVIASIVVLWLGSNNKALLYEKKLAEIVLHNLVKCRIIQFSYTGYITIQLTPII